MEILVCPVCKGELELTVAEADDGEVLEGGLHCAECDFTYPIDDGIPNLLPPEMQEGEAAGAGKGGAAGDAAGSGEEE